MRELKVFQNETVKELKDLYGIFFEDINHAADGGLYAELVQNRSFEFCKIDNDNYNPLTAWELSNGIDASVKTDNPLNENNKHYLSVKAKRGDYVENIGYNSGICVNTNEQYKFSIFARAFDKDMAINVSIINENGETCASDDILVFRHTTIFEKYELTLTSTLTTTNGRLRITFLDEGTYELDMVSLFPKNTFMGRENGLRQDLALALKDLKPKFVRFPGGCLIHDGSINDTDRDSMYRWKKTIGNVEERAVWRNNWRYNQTLGLGFYEYFLFCEDINAKPLPVLPGGFNPHKGIGVDMDKLDEWIEDALDLIEFANGDTNTTWGKIRASLGHKEPFNLEYIGIGNEEIGDGFFERYSYFHKAIKEKYPDIQIINTSGPFATGEGYDAGWKSAIENNSDMVDEHYYSSPEWFLANMHHYEDFDPNGPKVFLGEYASWGNTYYNAIVEAAYMTHLEKAKAVSLACYAPLLCNKDYVNWAPDMIWFDNKELVKTPNYYVQKLFMEHQGEYELKYEVNNFEEPIQLVDNDLIDGDITITGNDIEGKIWDITYTNLDTNEVTKATDIDITNENLENVCFSDVNARAYSLEFNFKRSAGRKGLKIVFGKKDNGNLVLFEFGGWDNWDCNIATLCNGKAATISHRIFHVEDIEYKIKLVVNVNKITTYVNGVNYNDTSYDKPQLEDMYIATSKEDNKTYVKLVNLTGEDKEVKITLDGDNKSTINITRLSGVALSSENTFENKDCITPQNMTDSVMSNEYVYKVPAHSVNVLEYI